MNTDNFIVRLVREREAAALKRQAQEERLLAEVEQLRARAVRCGFATSPASVRMYAGKLAAWVGGDPTSSFSDGVVLQTEHPALIALLYNVGFGPEA